MMPDGVVSGELTRFAAGDMSAGLLTSGFYPILMFGLPGAALAMIHVAKPKQKKLAFGILAAAATFAGLTAALHHYLLWSLGRERERLPLALWERVTFGLLALLAVIILIGGLALALVSGWLIQQIGVMFE